MILTPQQIDSFQFHRMRGDYLGHNAHPSAEMSAALVDTLLAYAEVVERVAQDMSGATWVCPFCGAIFDDIPPATHRVGCITHIARELMGYSQAQPQSDCDMLAQADKKHSNQ